MKIIVRAKPKAKKESVQRLSQPTLGLEVSSTELVEYKVSVKELPVDGKANEAIRKALSEYFDIPRSSVRIISGQTSKRKVFEIDEK